MGMLDRPIDIAGIPEFFYEHSELEDAGNGLVRIVRYIKRHGVIIPVCSTISPAISVLELGRKAEVFARDVLLISCKGVIGH